jgi:hypothetical protein
MNFKKIALVVAMAASFGSHAAVLDILDDFKGAGVVAAESMDDTSTTAYADFLAIDDADGNVAYVIQSNGAIPDGGTAGAGGSIAFVNQVDGNNYAIVMQQGVSGLVYVNQVGGTPINKAYVVQIDTGTTARTADLVTLGSRTATDIAQTEFTAPTTLTTSGSFVVISQTADVETNAALVYQNGTKLFAAVSQESGTAPGSANIVQVGAGMRAYIRQE